MNVNSAYLDILCTVYMQIRIQINEPVDMLNLLENPAHCKVYDFTSSEIREIYMKGHKR